MQSCFILFFSLRYFQSSPCISYFSVCPCRIYLIIILVSVFVFENQFSRSIFWMYGCRSVVELLPTTFLTARRHKDWRCGAKFDTSQKFTTDKTELWDKEPASGLLSCRKWLCLSCDKSQQSTILPGEAAYSVKLDTFVSGPKTLKVFKTCEKLHCKQLEVTSRNSVGGYFQLIQAETHPRSHTDLWLWPFVSPVTVQQLHYWV